MPKGLKVTGELYQQVSQQHQEIAKGFEKSTDPEITVFDYEAMKKYIFYFPDMIAGKPLEPINSIEHSVNQGKYSITYRCTRGLVLPQYGISGDCEFCKVMPEVWDIFDRKVNMLMEERKVDPNDKEAVTKIRREAGSATPISKQNEVITYPFIVFPIEQDETTKVIKFIQGTDGKIIFYPAVYTWNKKTFEEKFMGTLSNNEKSTINGTWWTVSYKYTPEAGKQPTKMDAGRKFVPTLRAEPESIFNPAYGVTKEILQNAIDKYTPERISGALTRLEIFTDEDMKKIVDRAMQSHRQTIAVLEARSATATQTIGSPLEALTNLQVPAE